MYSVRYCRTCPLLKIDATSDRLVIPSSSKPDRKISDWFNKHLIIIAEVLGNLYMNKVVRVLGCAFNGKGLEIARVNKKFEFLS